MFPPVSPLHFSSTIRLVSDEEFKRLPADELRQQGLSIDAFQYVDRLPFTEEAITEGACTCTAGGITNGKHASVFHLNTVSLAYQVPQITKALDEDIETLKAETPNLRAFLTGGWSEGHNSSDLQTLLLDIFKRHKIPVSFLWGQPHKPMNFANQGSAVHYSAQTDTWTIRVGWKDPANNKVRFTTTLDELKNSISQIHIEEGDHLFIGEREIDPTEVNNA